MQDDLAARRIESSLVELGHVESALGGAQQLRRVGRSRQQLEVVRARQRRLVTAVAKAGAGQQQLRDAVR